MALQAEILPGHPMNFALTVKLIDYGYPKWIPDTCHESLCHRKMGLFILARIMKYC
jgi:hypothetical protein